MSRRLEPAAEKKPSVSKPTSIPTVDLPNATELNNSYNQPL
uniref:Uncharacterized protein n=1 Tax=Moniliophthora roreri TaxID=221103 RepID=A0A0W0FL81_MONRR